MGHLRRIALSALFGFAVMILGIFIDAAVFELLEVTEQMDVGDGPFSSIPGQVEGAATLVVPMMLLGIVLWMIWGSIQEERREEVERRVGPR